MNRRNHFGLAPEQLASQATHAETSMFLRAARKGELDSTIFQHPDGLGSVPECAKALVSMLYANGLQPSESLRHAVNLAFGAEVLDAEALRTEAEKAASNSSSSQQGQMNETAAVALVHNVLSRQGYGVEVADGSTQDRHQGPTSFLVYEPPGRVSPDAPGHWVAMRWLPMEALAEKANGGHGGNGGEGGGSSASSAGGQSSVNSSSMDASSAETTASRASSRSPATSTDGAAASVAAAPAGHTSAGSSAGMGRLLRLDPVRGPFSLSAEEAAELLQRYPSWRISIA